MARPTTQQARIKLVKQYIAAYHAYESARETKLFLQTLLLPIIQDVGPIRVGHEEVRRKVSSKKTPTKKQLIVRFGEIAAQTFWDTVPESLSIYLAVSPNRRFTKKG